MDIAKIRCEICRRNNKSFFLDHDSKVKAECCRRCRKFFKKLNRKLEKKAGKRSTNAPASTLLNPSFG